MTNVSDPTLQLTIVTLNGDVLATPRVDANSSVQSLVQTLLPALQAARAGQVHLILDSDVLPPEQSFADLGLPAHGTVLHAVLQQATPYQPSLREAGIEFKLVLLGDWGVGKTTLVQQHLYGCGVAAAPYVSRLSVRVDPLRFLTNCGLVTFNVWDTAGQERFGGLRDGYYLNSHCGVIMFDVSSRQSYKHVPDWYRDVVRVCGNIPLVLVGNKVDLDCRQVKAAQVHFHRKKKLQFFEVSARTRYNFEKPFRWLARRLTNQAELQLVGDFAEEPTIQISNDTALQHSSELIHAASLPIGGEDDDL